MRKAPIALVLGSMALMAPMPILAQPQPGGQTTENPRVPAEEADYVAYLVGPGVAASSEAVGTAWFSVGGDGAQIAWTIEFTGMAATDAMVVCGEEPETLDGLQADLALVEPDAELVSPLQGDTNDTDSGLLDTIADGQCWVVIADADSERLMKGLIETP